MASSQTASTDALRGQIAVVTGASRGIGRVIAQWLARAGARVQLVARDQAMLAALADELDADGATTQCFAADVTDATAMRRSAEHLHATWGVADLVVANAGLLTEIGRTWETDPESWWRDVEVNLRGAGNTCFAHLPAMVDRGSGRVVLFGGGGSTQAFPFVSGYAVAKAAVVRLAETLDIECEGTGVRVFAVSPGFVRTEMTAPFATTAAGRRHMTELASRLDEGATTPPENCARLIAAIASGRLDGLHGRFVHAANDLEHLEDLVARADEIVRNGERVLGMRGLTR